MKTSELDKLIPPEIKDDPFYEALYKLAQSSEISEILEVGASAGEGSTEAFIKGILESGNPTRLHSLEISKVRFEVLSSRYRDVSFFTPYCSSSVSISGFLSESEVSQFYKNNKSNLNLYSLDEVLRWRKQDLDYILMNQIPQDGILTIRETEEIDRFDLVLIDGSAFTGQAELDLAYGARYICLDDINDIKNYENYHRLKKDTKYELQLENWQVRNGFAVFSIKS